LNINARSARARLLRSRDGYLIYGPQELAGDPQYDRRVDVTTGSQVPSAWERLLGLATPSSGCG